MNPAWLSRLYEPVSFTLDVDNPHPRAGEFEIGDTFVLYAAEDEERQDPVYVHLTDVAPSGRMMGMISRQTRRGAQGDPMLALGATVEFEGQQIFRHEKAT